MRNSVFGAVFDLDDRAGVDSGEPRVLKRPGSLGAEGQVQPALRLQDALYFADDLLNSD